MGFMMSLRTRLFAPGGAEPMSDVSDMPGPQSADRHDVVMYSTRYCPFCMRARALLQEKNVRYREIAVDGNPELRREMAVRAGHNTVPQIWIGEQHIGGCDELMALERQGRLDDLLGAANE